MQSGADTVVITSGHLTPRKSVTFHGNWRSSTSILLCHPGMVDVAAPRLSVWLVGGQPLIHVEKPQYSGAKRFDKRVFDFVFSLMVLLARCTDHAAAALAIKLTSRGPVFYLSHRVGLDGKPFRMIKFRSMVVDADKRFAEVAHLNEMRRCAV